MELKRWQKIAMFFMSIPLLFVLFCIIFACVRMTQEGLWEELPYHFRRGDHINCELQVTVDGQPVTLTAENVTVTDGNGAAGNLTLKDGTARCSIAGGEKTNQYMTVTVQPEGVAAPAVIPFDIFPANGWEVAEITLLAEISTADSTVNCTGNIQMYHAEGTLQTGGQLGEKLPVLKFSSV